LRSAIIDARQEMLDVMKFTAQAVSEIAINPSVKKELLSYGLQEFDGEVTAHFSKLLNDGNPEAVSSDNSKGTFSRLFENKAQQFESNQLNIKSQSAGSTITDLEAFLKDKNMALYGPYLAENHANSDKPITVSFDPLNGSKTSSIGYILVPKTSSGSTANSGGLDAPNAISNYELIEISGIDDDYAYNNPTLFVIIDDAGSSGGGGSVANTGSGSSSGNTSTRAIDCRDLSDDDLIQLYMRKFRLMGNLRSAPWNRNFLDMWVITSDDISFDTNNTAVVNENTAKLWRTKQVSREDGRKQNWLNSDIGALDLNWIRQEVNAYMILAYKSGNDGGSVTADVETIIKSDGTNETTTTLSATILLSEKFESFYQFPYDRCGTLAVFRTDQGLGLNENLSIFGANKMQFTLEAILR
jgi:hypothetical protein